MSIGKIGKSALSGLLCLLLASCAGIPQQKTIQTEAVPFSCTGDIVLNGRISMHFSRDGNDEAVHGGFLWVETGDRTGITLTSPLGQTIATIDVTPESATLKQSGRPPRTAADPDALAASELGWPLPIAGMQGWLRGCAVAANGQPFVASPQADSVVTREGWRIRYVTWQEEPSARHRPRRIDMERSGNASSVGDITLRLVIDSWQAP